MAHFVHVEIFSSVSEDGIRDHLIGAQSSLFLSRSFNWRSNMLCRKKTHTHIIELSKLVSSGGLGEFYVKGVERAADSKMTVVQTRGGPGHASVCVHNLVPATGMLSACGKHSVSHLYKDCLCPPVCLTAAKRGSAPHLLEVPHWQLF